MGVGDVGVGRDEYLPAKAGMTREVDRPPTVIVVVVVAALPMVATPMEALPGCGGNCG